MKNSVSSASQTPHLATFQSRGVAAPYTTPFLAGARVRKASHAGNELVLPNPSGSRGVYIVPWAGIRELCNPTMHDTMLSVQIAELARIDPASVRGVALDIAIIGYAGREAAAAAERASDTDRAQRSLARALIVGNLVQQVDPGGRKATNTAERADFDRQMIVALHRIAVLLGCPPAHLEKAVVSIGDTFAPVGVARDDRSARIPRLIDLLKDTFFSLSRWLAEDPGHDVGGLGQAMTATIKAIYGASQTMLIGTRALLSDPMALIKRWVKIPDDVIAVASRCDWLLDGWERVCRLWQGENASPSRRGTLLEMAQVLPVLPHEVKDWPDMAAPHQTLSQEFHVTSHSDAWRSGSAALPLILRNERLRAMTL